MKVMLLNGSPRADGNTYTALKTVADRLGELGIDSEIFQLGTEPVAGCTACKACYKLGRCVKNDRVVEFAEKLKEADGLIVGTPVYFAAPNGSLIAFLNRLFYSEGHKFRFKPAAAIACARRGGTTATLDVLNKYFALMQMPIVSSTYWNIVHGLNKGEVLQDAEGLRTMRNLAQNMAWMLNCIESGKAAGIMPPKAERGDMTNFIR